MDYDERPDGTTLSSVTRAGYRRDVPGARSVPPVAFAYSLPAVARAFQPAAVETSENTPAGLGNGGPKWVDLFGEGLLGLLTETGAGWFYKSNEGRGQFGPQRLVLSRPAHRLADCVFNDFDGDGNTDLVALHGRGGGFYEFDRDGRAWDGFRPFDSLPHVEAAGGRAQWLDLDGDGLPDLLVSDGDRLTWYACLGKDGFGPGTPVTLPRPTASFAAAAGGAPPVAEAVELDYFFADMNGDGLVDQVLVRDGRVEYWPQLGNGRFADASVLMDGSPQFAQDGQFDPARLLFADLNGDGAADLLYVGNGQVRFWTNAAGNALIEGATITGLPYVDDVSTLRVLDFLGDGTACLVWSSPLEGRADPIQYLPLTNGVRPRLLLSVSNSMGLEHRLTYGNTRTPPARPTGALRCRRRTCRCCTATPGWRSC